MDDMLIILYVTYVAFCSFGHLNPFRVKVVDAQTRPPETLTNTDLKYFTAKKSFFNNICLILNKNLELIQNAFFIDV